MKAGKVNKCEENSLEKLEGLDCVSRTGKQVFQKIICGGGTGGGRKGTKIYVYKGQKIAPYLMPTIIQRIMEDFSWSETTDI